MKKIYFLLAMLLGFCFPAMAQDALEEHVFDKETTIKLGVALASFEPNVWYFVYQGRPYNTDGSVDQFSNVGELPRSDGGVLTDVGLGEKIMKKTWNDVSSPVVAETFAGYVARFIPVEGKDGVFLIQFGTGRYMGELDGNTFNATDNIYDAGEFNFYNIDSEQPGYFGFNVYNFAERIDNNGTGTAVVTWNSGQRTAVEVGNSIWNIHQVEWGRIDPIDALLEELVTLWREMDGKNNEISGSIGTGIGQYSESTYNAFKKALDDAYALTEKQLDPMYMFTEEELKSAIDLLKSTYEAVINSKVAFTLADGYYRIRCASKYVNDLPTGELDGEENPITEPTEVDKYMYSIKEGQNIFARWQTPDDLASDCSVLWRITNSDENFDVVNMATDARFNNVATSTAVTMSTTSENKIAIAVAENIEGEIHVNFRVATQDANGAIYLHIGGHSDGKGVSGYIVGWYAMDSGSPMPASTWVLDPVSDKEAQDIIAAYSGIKDHDQMVADYHEMLTDANEKLVIAKDIIDRDKKLIKSADQFFSPYSHNDLNESVDGADLSSGVLIDNDVNNYWHTAWQNDPGIEEHHYLQVEIVEDEVPASIVFEFTRRQSQNDHITSWAVYGYEDNNKDLLMDAGDLLATVETPYSNNRETLISEPFATKGYRYLRFYCMATNNPDNSKFFHLAEFQLYPFNESPTTQYKVMGNIATNLEKVITDQSNIGDAELTIQNYNNLKAAYDAFIAIFVDPTELRDLMASLKDKPASVEVGTQPGFWLNNSTGGALETALDNADKYDKAGAYTPAKSEEIMEDLKAKSEAIDKAAITISEGKWYRIRFGTEDEFDAHQWDKVAGDYNTTQTVNGTKYDINETLWGKYITLADCEDEVRFEGKNEKEEDVKVTAHNVLALNDPDAVTLGQYLYVDDDTDIAQKDLSYFRFVNVGDSAYVIQNKATGLFLKAAGISGEVTLSIQPSLFNVQPIGYGLNTFPAQNLLTGSKESYLHVQNAYNRLVTWGVNYAGSRSGLYIEEVGDVEEAYDGSAFNFMLQPNSITAFCYPVDISAKTGMYGVNNVTKDGDGNVAIELNALTTVAAGRPFLAIPGTPEDYDSDAATEPATFKHGYQFVRTALDASFLKGTFTEINVGSGCILPEENGFVVTKKSQNPVAANHGYISLSEPLAPTATATFTLTTNEDGIAEALSNVAKSGNIYTLDGRLITRNGNLNTLRRMGKGVYIVNGTKVIVK